MKKILSMLLVVTLLFSMVACGNKTTTEDKKMASETKSGSQAASNKESTGATDKITLKIANYAILEKGYTEFWENAKTKFEEKYPNVTIEWVTAPYAEILNTVINMAGG